MKEQQFDRILGVSLLLAAFALIMVIWYKHDYVPTVPFEVVGERVVNNNDEENLISFITVTGLPENAVVKYSEDSESLFGLDIWVDDTKYSTCLSVCGNNMSTVSDTGYLKEVGL